MKIGASERFFILIPTICLIPKIGSHMCTSQVVTEVASIEVLFVLVLLL